MSERADAVVAELRRNERNRRWATALVVVIVLGGTMSTFVIHSWLLRIAIGCVCMLGVLLLAALASSALDPFTMESATRARNAGIMSAKAEATAEKLDDLFEVEAAATKAEEKRDEA